MYSMQNFCKMQTGVQIYNLIVGPNFCRCISSSSVGCNKTRESRFLNKLMTGRKKTFSNKSVAKSQSHIMTINKIVSTHKTRRTEVLNKLFMKHITDLMATGEVAPQLVGRGIDITHVSVTSDFKTLNVFWFGKDDEGTSESTESVLRRCGGHLQHELSQLRVIGIVPPIRFIKNKHMTLVNEVENRLASIDFGEDFEPTTLINKSNEPVIFTKLSSETKLEIIDLKVTNQSEEDDAFEVDLPEMRHDVFDLDRYKIMKKVQASVSRIQTPVENRTPLTSQIDFGKNIFPEKQLSSNERREMFSQFLKQRKIQAKRNVETRMERHDSFEGNSFEKNLHDIEAFNAEEEKEHDKDFILEDESLREWK